MTPIYHHILPLPRTWNGRFWSSKSSLIYFWNTRFFLYRDFVMFTNVEWQIWLLGFGLKSDWSLWFRSGFSAFGLCTTSTYVRVMAAVTFLVHLYRPFFNRFICTSFARSGKYAGTSLRSFSTDLGTVVPPSANRPYGHGTAWSLMDNRKPCLSVIDVTHFAGLGPRSGRFINYSIPPNNFQYNRFIMNYFPPLES